MARHHFISLITLMSLAAPVAVVFASEESVARPNILFIAIDDLRNDLGALGVDHASTPRLDAFAQTSRLFSHHYTQVPSCGPSRAALLSGSYPTSARHIRNRAILTTGDEWEEVSLPAWFRQNGYYTQALGKVSHYPGGLSGEGWAEGPAELPNAWDRHEVPSGSPWQTPQDMMHGYADGQARIPGESLAIEVRDVPDTAYPDAWIAAEAVEALDRLAKTGHPWFFAVGFIKPHLPFAAPKRWFDQVDPGSIPVPAHVPEGPVNFPGWHPSYEMMRAYGHDGRDPRKDLAYATELRHA